MHAVQILETPALGAKETLVPLLESKRARIGVIGLGYVGLPLALEFASAGFETTGFDVDGGRVDAINAGRSPLLGIDHADVQKQRRRLKATTEAGGLAGSDCIIICVPTPLNAANDPDVSHIATAARTIAHHLRGGQLIVLESTTYPGSTEELLLLPFQQAGFELDEDFLLAFSPERIDPGNPDFVTRNIPKIVGGCSPDSTEVATLMYRQIVEKVHQVGNARIAETAKLLENTFRSVNIALINEMALLCEKLNIDVWEAIDAAATKPFGYMPFYPGPGVGGHCIPLDPQYLAWKGRQHGFKSRFIPLAREVNAAMPECVVSLAADALNERGVTLNGASVLVLGAAYKKDVDDARESPAVDVIALLRRKKARVTYHDPYVPELCFENVRGDRRFSPARKPGDRRHDDRGHLWGPGRRQSDRLESVELTPQILRESDCVVIVTDHSRVDYRMVVENAPLIVDTRNVLSPELREGARGKIVRL